MPGNYVAAWCVGAGFAFCLVITTLGSPAAAQQDGLFVIPREQVPYCAEPQHRHWIETCGRVILEVEPGIAEPPDARADPWGMTGENPTWTPEDSFAEAFTARCVEILPGALAVHRPETCPCSLGEHVAWVAACVDEFLEVEPGMRRRQVEERFRRDGGIVMGGQLRLVHPDCPMLKLDVAFEFEPGSGFPDEPESLVITVGEPYLEYPFSD